MIVPGTLVRRHEFINYVYRWCDCDMSDGVERTALATPLLYDDSPGMTDDQAWPLDRLAVVAYVSPDPEAPACLVVIPHTGLAWVPTKRIEPIGTFHEEGADKPGGCGDPRCAVKQLRRDAVVKTHPGSAQS